MAMGAKERYVNPISSRDPYIPHSAPGPGVAWRDVTSPKQTGNPPTENRAQKHPGRLAQVSQTGLSRRGVLRQRKSGVPRLLYMCLVVLSPRASRSHSPPFAAGSLYDMRQGRAITCGPWLLLWRLAPSGSEHASVRSADRAFGPPGPPLVL